jgi:integrase
VRQSGLSDIRFHDLRHTCLFLLLGRSIHAKHVQHLVGHASVQLTLDRYSRRTPSTGRPAADGRNEAEKKA